MLTLLGNGKDLFAAERTCGNVLVGRRNNWVAVTRRWWRVNIRWNRKRSIAHWTFGGSPYQLIRCIKLSTTCRTGYCNRHGRPPYLWKYSPNIAGRAYITTSLWFRTEEIICGFKSNDAKAYRFAISVNALDRRLFTSDSLHTPVRSTAAEKISGRFFSARTSAAKRGCTKIRTRFT